MGLNGLKVRSSNQLSYQPERGFSVPAGCAVPPVCPDQGDEGSAYHRVPAWVAEATSNLLALLGGRVEVVEVSPSRRAGR